MISTDTPEDNKAFAEKERADFPILSNPDQQVAKAYGVLGDFSKFGLGMRPNRWTFYIGPDGKILAIDKKIVAAKAGEGVVATLQELKVARR